MHDGPDDDVPRSRRTRTDDLPPAPDTAADGADDVLDRYGLRTPAAQPEDEAPRRRRAADRTPPWPPRARRRADGPPASEEASTSGTAAGRRSAGESTNGRPVDDGEQRSDGREPRRRGRTGPHARNGRAGVDRPAAGPGRVPRDDREPGPEPSGEARNPSTDDRTDALPSVTPQGGGDGPPRRRRGAADSRHTEVMAVTPRRRARDDEPAPPADEPAAAGPPPVAPPTAAGPPTPAPPTSAPSTPASPQTPPDPPGPATPQNATSRAAAPGAPSRTTPSRPTGSRTPAAAPGPAAPGPAAPGPAAPTGSPDEPDDAPASDDPPARTRRPGVRAANGRRPENRPATDRDDPPPPAGPGRRLLRVGAAVVAVLVFVACASGFASRQTVDGGIRTIPALDTESDAISSRNVQARDENVLVIGLPADRAGVPEAMRGDTAVLVHLPAGGAPAVTLGFPPTLEVARPPCQRWDGASGAYGETVPAESRTAFSAAYDVGGPKCAVGVVQQVTGLVVTRFVAFDLAGVDPLVDAVRGVGVCTERPVVDRTLGPVAARPGDTVLGGTEAERFSAATGVDDTSPADRVRRQQRVLSSVLDSALSTPSLLTPGASDRVARALPGAVTADGAGVGDLLVLSRSLSRSTGEDAAPPYVSIPVNEQPNTRGHLELNRGDSSDLFSALREHEPLPPAFTVPAQRTGSLLLPQGTVVDVLNAAGRSGLADEIATALRAQGYAIGAVSDAPPTPDTKIRFSPDRSDASGMLAGSVPGARPEADPAGTGTLELVLGSSFPGASALGAPARPAGPTADCD